MITYLSLLIAAGNTDETPHAVYISVVEITTGEIKVKVFTDDLMDAIRNHSKSVSNASEAEFCGRHRKELQNYFKEKLKVRINQKPVSFNYHSSSQEGDSFWISFDFSMNETWKSIRVEDRHFMELFPTQSNIVKINGPAQRFGKLSATQASCSFEF